MADVKIAEVRTLRSLDEIRKAKPEMVFYSARTCWWTTNPKDLGCGPDVPLDPAGAPLFQTDDVEGFLASAEAEPEHYGRHGLEAFILAYHGNVVSTDGLPRCSPHWEQYNKLLDALEGE
jgi:hypothetical protein